MIALASSLWRVGTAGRLLNWVAENRDCAGIAVVQGSSGELLAGVSADQLFPLASTVKVVHLVAYAEAVARDGRLAQERVLLADVDAWYWQGTDGGAHEHARREWLRAGSGDDRTVSLDAIVRGAIVHSSNAAADYLLARFGPLKTPDGDSITPFLGEFRAWSRTTPDEWVQLPSATRHAYASEAVHEGSGRAWTLPSLEDQRRFAGVSLMGRPATWARYLARLGDGRGMRAAARDVVRRHLEWPLEQSGNRTLFDRFATKGGSLPGVLAEASYVQAKGRQALAVAFFLRDLPPPVERALHITFRHQGLILRLAESESFLDEARARFG